MEKKFASIWKRIAALIKPEVGEDPFQRWFKPVELVRADEEQLTLRVPNNIFQHWIEINYMGFVQSAVLQVLGGPREIKFCFAAECADEGDELFATRGTTEAAERHPPQPPAVSATGMNPRNTFDSFVVGRNNEIAHAAARAVAESPAKSYNPLFLYGGVGLGKTHLMQAIGQYVFSTKKNAKVIYLSSEKFTNEFIDAIQNNTLVKFRKRYRQADVLFIDDIQFLAGKERSQEEFFHTFNTLFDGHKQIVLSSDRPPSEIANLEHRLVSRFEWGLTAELQPPDVETRVAILRKKAAALNIKLDNSMYEFLAQRVRSNVRRLEGRIDARRVVFRDHRARARAGSRRTPAQGHPAGRGEKGDHHRSNPEARGRAFRRAARRHDQQAPPGKHRLSAADCDVSREGVDQSFPQRDRRRLWGA